VRSRAKRTAVAVILLLRLTHDYFTLSSILTFIYHRFYLFHEFSENKNKYFDFLAVNKYNYSCKNKMQKCKNK